MKLNICHISTLHPRFDVRIFHKQCKSLAKKHKVNLIVADGKGDQNIDSVNIHDIGLSTISRIRRAFVVSNMALKKALELNCDVYHIHDPELIKIGVKLLKNGKKVIYDVHEDLPRQVFGKPYISQWLKPTVSKIIEWQENKSAKKFSYICAATPFIRDRFLNVNPNTIDINNYPILSDNTITIDYNSRENALIYIGGISDIRGVYELIDSLSISKIKLHLAGDFKDDTFKEKCMDLDGWKYVEFHGYLSRNAVIELLNKSKVGIVTLHPLINYLDSLPVKMFEYMYAGIPVISSNFDFWKTLVEPDNAGVTVNPLSAKEIAEASVLLLKDNLLAEEMGRNGRNAVIEKYNWTNEEQKLFNIYENIK